MPFLSPVKGNFRATLTNIAADIHQENGFLEVLREAIPNCMDHGATTMRLAIFSTPKNTAILFCDDGTGMDVQDKPARRECEANSTFHSFFCQGQSSNEDGAGSTGRFCAGVKLIMHAADDYFQMCSKTEGKAQYLRYSSNVPIDDIVASQAGDCNIKYDEVVDPFEGIRKELVKMCKSDRSHLPKWDTIINSVKEWMQELSSGTLLFIISSGDLHTAQRYDTKVHSWPPLSGKNSKDLTLIKSNKERNALVTYIRTRTRYGTYLNQSYCLNFRNIMEDLSEGDIFTQRHLQVANLFVHDIRTPEGFLVPHGMPYIQHTRQLQYNDTTTLCGVLDKAAVNNTGAFLRIKPRVFTDSAEKKYYVLVLFDSKRYQGLSYEFLDRSGHTRGKMSISQVFGGVIVTAGGTYVQHIPTSLFKDSFKTIDSDDVKKFVNLLEDLGNQMTIVIESDWDIQQNRNALSASAIATFKSQPFLAGLKETIESIILDVHCRDGAQLHELLKWNSENHHNTNAKNAQDFRQQIKGEIMKAHRIRFTKRDDMEFEDIPEAIRRLHNHVEIMPFCESMVSRLYGFLSNTFHPVETLHPKLYDIIVDRASKNNNIDMTLIHKANRDRFNSLFSTQATESLPIPIYTAEIKTMLLSSFDHNFVHTDIIMVDSISHIQDNMSVEDAAGFVGQVSLQNQQHDFHAHLINIVDADDKHLKRLFRNCIRKL